MYSIANDKKHEINIKHSRFICHLYPAYNLEDIKKHLKDISTQYSDATHNCYAYICGSQKKASDDGEPSKTAGLPILNVLEMNNLNFVLAIVTRYFGGIKLGANGLIRAYADCVKETLKQAEIIELVDGLQLEITLNYDNAKKIDHLLKDYDITNKEYKEQITYIVNVPNDNELLKQLSTYVTYKIKQKVLVVNKKTVDRF